MIFLSECNHLMYTRHMHHCKCVKYIVRKIRYLYYGGDAQCEAFSDPQAVSDQ